MLIFIVGCNKMTAEEDIEYGYRENELIAAFDLPTHWLMMQMKNYCIIANIQIRTTRRNAMKIRLWFYVGEEHFIKK